MSFLPFFEIKILSSGRSAGSGSRRLCCQPPRAWRRTWASGVQTPPGGTPPRRRPGLALGDARPPRGHLLPPALGKRRQQGRGCGRCWRGRVRVGREPALIAHSGRPARVLARPPRPGVPGAAAAPSRLAGSQSAARSRGGTPSRTARPTARRRLSARVHPRRLLLASGPQRLSSPGTAGPEHRTPPRASPGRPGQLRRSPRRCRHPPGPRLLPFLSTSNFRASREKLKGRAGAERQRGKHPLPLPARLHLGARPWVRRRPLARRGRWRLFLFPSAPRPRARRRRLSRNLPGAYRNLLCGVTAFRLNPASSSRPSSRPLRRSRMLARCAAPPPGSWVAAGGRPRPARTPRASGRWSPAERRGSGPEGGHPGPGAQRPHLGDPGAAAGWPYVSSQPDSGPFALSSRPGSKSQRWPLFWTEGRTFGTVAEWCAGVQSSRFVDVDRSARLSSALCCVCSSSRVRSWKDCVGEQRALETGVREEQSWPLAASSLQFNSPYLI